ncbi:hypothetical protein LQ938_06900 [Microbacterium sp. cx-55]|uniref:hypothetical protein n=1 Tax=Microbacterium sp. cx-55 TaxID=2875948 RepID=UPI001CBF3693|nr:hypothetical protein [Microbacterium sp. cx-55]MBZ4486526.1 hypothetical protein [Microbacterium sp. cx-55]UGB36506.1 hypothetical protein LQ938_06900 [Microbacterium sp. cx-55]
MNFDLATASLMTAFVANVAGVLFIVDTLLRRDDAAGRIWAIAFLSGMATTVAYALWASGAGGVVAIAIGNALFVNTTGCMWLGSRKFNERRMGPAAIVVVLAGILVAAAVLAEGSSGGDWAGWLVMGLSLVGFAALAAVETTRYPMGRIGTARVLTAVLAVECVFYLARSIVFVTAGPDSDLFQVWFGSLIANFVTIGLTIVAVAVLSVLRAGRAELRGYSWMTRVGSSSDGILLGSTITTALEDVVERAGWRGDLIALIAVRVEGIAQIRTAFGADVAGDVTHAWRQGVRRFAPSASLVGEDGEYTLLVIAPASTAADARRQAGTIYRGLFEAFGRVSDAVIPAVGVGVGLTETVGYDPKALLWAAREASEIAATSIESSVLFGGASTIGERGD